LTIRVRGYVNSDGELRAQVPEGYPEGEIEFDLPEAIESAADASTGSNPAYSLDELHELLRPEPQSGAEIAASPEVGSWAQLGIRSGQEWVDKVRRRDQKQRGVWRWNEKAENDIEVDDGDDH
jgi:hypothetical protein